MEQDDKKEPPPFVPVLHRLDRLDHLMQLLEEKHSLSGRACSKQPEVRSSEVFQLKRISNALEEVNHKGTLMERLEFLEKRLLQLSIYMDEGNTSRSSSSTLAVSEKVGNSSCLSSVTNEVSEDGTQVSRVVKPQCSSKNVSILRASPALRGEGEGEKRIVSNHLEGRGKKLQGDGEGEVASGRGSILGTFWVILFMEKIILFKNSITKNVKNIVNKYYVIFINTVYFILCKI